MSALAGAAIYNKLKPSARDLVANVHEYMRDVLWKLTTDVVLAFPRLQTVMKALVDAHTSQMQIGLYILVMMLLYDTLASTLCIF